MTDTGILISRFERFAEAECGSSPLYRRLAVGIAHDRDLLELADCGTGGPKPNLILAAVHYLLLKGAEHPLAAYYPSLSQAPLPPAEACGPFRHFCLEHAGEIRALITTRRVQTNEVARSSFLVPAFGFLSGQMPGRPLALVEVGTSAGLLLFWDRYAYDYGTGITYGSPGSPVLLRCELRGPGQPPVSAELPVIASRTGIDLNLIDLHDPDATLWLRALVWPDQPHRAERLTRAAGLVAAQSPTLLQGDCLELLPAALAAVPREAVPCVFHAHTLNQFTPAGRERFLRLIANQSGEREMWLLSLEGAGVMPMPGRPAGSDPGSELWATRFLGGEPVLQRLLARYDAHGEWLKWM